MHKKIFIQTMGIVFIALGITAMIKGNLGISPYDAMNANLTRLLGLDSSKIGLVTLIPGFLISLICFIIEPKKDIILTIVLLFVLALAIYGWTLILGQRLTSNLPLMFFYSIFGLFTLALGTALSVKSSLAPTPPDRLLVLMSKIMNIGVAKVIIEASYFIIALILGGISGAGILSGMGLFTIICVFALGPLVHIFASLIGKKINFSIKKEESYATQ